MFFCKVGDDKKIDFYLYIWLNRYLLSNEIVIKCTIITDKFREADKIMVKLDDKVMLLQSGLARMNW